MNGVKKNSCIVEGMVRKEICMYNCMRNYGCVVGVRRGFM